MWIGGNRMKRIYIVIVVLAFFSGLQVMAGDFTDNGDGTITDNVTGLMWQKEDDNISRTWESSIMYCEGLSLSNYSDWRLPNPKELKSIVDYTTYSPAIDLTYFPNTIILFPNGWFYWSSTTLVNFTSDAWYVEYASGFVGSEPKSSSGYVRCVRGGQ